MAHRVGYFRVTDDSLEYISSLESLPVVDDITGEMMALIKWWRVTEKSPIVIEVYDNQYVTRYLPDEPPNSLPVFAEVTAFNDGTKLINPIQLERVPVFEFKPFRNGQSLLSSSVDSQQNAYDRLKTMKGDEFQKTKAINFDIVTGGMSAEEIIMIREMAQKLGLAPVEGGIGADASIKMNVAEYPVSSVVEQLREYENGIFRDMEVTNVNAITVGNVTATAITEARKSEFKKAREMADQLTNVLNRILEFKGLEPDVEITIYEDIDESEIAIRRYTLAKAFALYNQIGMPFTEIVRLMDLSTEEKERIIQTYHTQMLSYKDKES